MNKPKIHIFSDNFLIVIAIFVNIANIVITFRLLSLMWLF